MAKAGDDELKEMHRFARQMEQIENYSFREYTPEEHKEAGDSELLAVEDTINGGVDTTRWLEAWTPFLTSGAIERILCGYATMFANACDPDAETLEWNEKIKEGFALWELQNEAKNEAGRKSAAGGT